MSVGARVDAASSVDAGATDAPDSFGDGSSIVYGDGSSIVTDDCNPVPPPEATRKAGVYGDTVVLPGGRTLTPAGLHGIIGGYPADARLHPSLPVAYVANTGYADGFRSVQVVSTETGTPIQEIVRADSFYGIALSALGTRLYVSGGFSSLVDVYDVAADGKLAPDTQLSVANYPAGLALSQDGTKLWVGEFKGNAVAEFDTQTSNLTRTISIPFGAYNLLEVPERNELYVAGFADDRVAVIDLGSPLTISLTTVQVGADPLGLVKSPAGDRVYVTVSNGDAVVAIDTTSHAVVDTRAVGEPSIHAEDGTPLPASSPGGLAIDSKGDSLYVARAADNAVSVFDAKTLTFRGAIPVAWYPTSVTLSRDDATMFVTNGKGVGTGPLRDAVDNAGKALMKGSVSVVRLGSLDLAAETAKVEANVRRPDEVFPFHCSRPFPIPPQPSSESPIQHIVLIVRENKTYDALLGDFARGEHDASMAIYGEKITPNLHALAQQFANHDNFYDDSETSVQGHFWLTSSFCNDYMERTWFEDYRNHPGWSNDPVLPQARPSWLTFFTHLMKHNVDFSMYGEIVGALDNYNGVSVGSGHSDLLFPGGPYFNLDAKDEDKARYVGQKLVDDGKFPPFVYLVLPNDHTQGLSAGKPTPESMIADNDYATGILLDKLSHSSYWNSTAVFIVEDDPQVGQDHVDYHRSILVVASPWAKHAYTSSVHTSYPSLFRTFELILHLPPMSRYDALATPLWDAFTLEPNDAPFTALPSNVPASLNPSNSPLADYSDAMDFSRPDANPDLDDLLAWARTGVLPRSSRLGRMSPDDLRAERLERESRDPDGDGD